jgi:hypothetical protein
MIYLLTAIGLLPGGSSTVHIYIQTICGTTKITTNLEERGPFPRLCEFYPGICLTTEEKVQKNLSQGKKKPQSEYSVHITYIFSTVKYSVYYTVQRIHE